MSDLRWPIRGIPELSLHAAFHDDLNTHFRAPNPILNPSLIPVSSTLCSSVTFA